MKNLVISEVISTRSISCSNECWPPEKASYIQKLADTPPSSPHNPHANERRGAGSEVDNCSCLCEEKTLMLGKTEGKGEDAEDNIDSVTSSMEMNLSKLLEIV